MEGDGDDDFNTKSTNIQKEERGSDQGDEVQQVMSYYTRMLQIKRDVKPKR